MFRKKDTFQRMDMDFSRKSCSGCVWGGWVWVCVYGCLGTEPRTWTHVLCHEGLSLTKHCLYL